ncbi:MAG: aldo/keto reductase [Streptosporangiaceae bacterium]
MRQRVISDSRVSLTVSELCLGTMYFGYRTDEQASFAILDRFLEAGGTFLDTANNYGQWHGDAGESERVIGRWLRSRRVAGQVVAAVPAGGRPGGGGDQGGRPHHGARRPGPAALAGPGGDRHPRGRAGQPAQPRRRPAGPVLRPH